VTTQIIFILIFVGFSVAQGLFKYLSAQAEKRRQQQSQQRSELELLRTGRTAEVSEQSSPIDSDARRREELAELRRRAQARREPEAEVDSPRHSERSNTATPLEILLGLPPGTTSGGTAPPSSSRAPRTARPSTLNAPTKSRPQKERGDPEAKRRRQEQQRLRAQQSAAAARREQEILDLQMRTARAAAQAGVVDQRLLRDAKPIGGGRSALGTIGVVPRSAAEWRRAIAMNEVLAKPISMRSAGD
jgi:hypothetical protein